MCIFVVHTHTDKFSLIDATWQRALGWLITRQKIAANDIIAIEEYQQ